MSNDAQDLTSPSPWSADRVGALYDFSLDIARHENDLEFADSGGTIHYVFDENVFELFVHPFENFDVVQRDPFPRVEETEEQARKRHVQGMQTALFTSEILFGSGLLGQALGGPIYLSNWHRWELLARMNELMAQYAGERLPILREAAPELLKRKLQFLARNASRPADEDMEGIDRCLPDDIRRLIRQIRISEEALTPFIRNRVAAAELARDETIEPAQQLARILEPSMQDRLRGLATIRRPGDNQLAELEQRSRRWMKAIRAEVEARATRRQTRQRKGKTAIWNDAQSLAHLEWVSEHLDPRRERVVFVTGDTSLFDAYRRVFEENPARIKTRLRQFLLRRPTQYSPLFLADESPQQLGSHKELLSAVQQAVEMALVPLRLAALRDNSVTEDLAERRYSLTLSPIDQTSKFERSYLAPFWERYRRAYQVERLSEVDQALDFTERSVGGFLGHLVERRIGEELGELFDQAAGKSEADQSKMFEAYVDRSVEKLIVRAVEIWKPIAVDFFDETVAKRDPLPSRLVPLAAQMALGREDDSVDLRGFLALLLRPRSERPADAARGIDTSRFLTSAFDIFIASGAVALLANQWRQSEHFCDVAINSFGYFAKRDKIDEGDAAEAYYLSALSKRFRLGQIVPSQNFDGFSGARKLFEGAKRLLSESVRLARLGRRANSGEPLARFAAYRANSELAALSLFYAEFCSAQAQQLQGVGGVGEIEAAAREAFLEARDFLVACIQQGPGDTVSRVAPRLDGTAGELLRMQTLVNICAWHALGPVIKETRGQTLPELSREGRNSLQQLLSALEGVSNPLFSAEVLAFKILHDIEPEKSRAELGLLRAQADNLQLELDRRVFEKIVGHWLAEGPAA